MKRSELYYLVGLAGSGKTTVCQQLAKSIEDGCAVQTSSKLSDYLSSRGVDGFKGMKSLPVSDKRGLIDSFHQSLSGLKELHQYTFLDGHMLVEDQESGEFVGAMASQNWGVATGIIYLNTPCTEVEVNVSRDNAENKRERRSLSLIELRSRAEAEWVVAESFALEHHARIGVLFNFGKPDCQFKDVVFLDVYYLTAESEIRNDYLQQFDQGITPSDLRKRHFLLGRMMADSFHRKIGESQADYQVLSVPRSGNLLALGFTADFDGSVIAESDAESIRSDLDVSKPLVIIDSVIDSGRTIKSILSKLPEGYSHRIDVICLAINFKSLGFIRSLKGKVEFHCLGFSNKEQRPIGINDMGARLYGTSR